VTCPRRRPLPPNRARLALNLLPTLLPSLPDPSLPLSRLAVPPSSRSPAPSVRSRSSQLRAASVAFVAVRSRPARSLLSAVQPLRTRFAPVGARPLSVSSVCRTAALRTCPAHPRPSPPGASHGGARRPLEHAMVEDAPPKLTVPMHHCFFLW